MVVGFKYERIEAGDTVTVVFGDTTPDLTGTFREYLQDGGIIALTTPAGETDPTIYQVHHIGVFQYMYAGVPPVTSGIDESELVGETVTVVYDRQNNANITGVVTSVDRSAGLLLLDVGGTETLVPLTQVWHIDVQ